MTTWQVIRRLSTFAAPHWPSIALAFVFVAGTAALSLLRPWPLKFTFDSILSKGTDALEGTTLYLVIGIAALVVAIAFFDGLFTYAHTYFINRAGRSIAFDMQSGLFAHIQRLSLQFHSRKQTGDLIARVTNDVRILRETLVDSVLEVINSSLFLVGMTIVLLVIDWPLTLAALAPAPLLYFLLVRFTSQIRVLSRAERKREGAVASLVHETLGAMRLTWAFNRQEEANRKFREESAASLDSGFAATLLEERSSWVVDVLGSIATATVFGFGVQRVVAGAITPGELIVFISYIRNFYKPLSAAVKHTNKIVKAVTRAERVLEVLDAEEGVTDRPGARRAPALQGTVAFQGVAFEYEPGAPVLHEIELSLPAGRVTAIVGATGAGKTTLVSLIPRLYDPTQGAVLIDGEDVRSYTLQSLRSQVSMVLQESVLFRTTIADNIAYGRARATMDDIVAAARAANAHEFIIELRDGYHTVVGERGETLSGGQRQRIAIARAMIRNAPILILDEPLAGLDAASAAAVLDALERLMGGRTAILITHQLATAQHADHVVVLDDRRVVQEGTHGELMRADGRYREFAQAQFKDVPQFRDILTARS